MKIHPQIKTYILRFALLVFAFQMSYGQGTNSPEAAGFEPVDATDMVNLTNGDFTYVVPLMSVEGFPISLSYHAGMTRIWMLLGLG